MARLTQAAESARRQPCCQVNAACVMRWSVRVPTTAMRLEVKRGPHRGDRREGRQVFACIHVRFPAWSSATNRTSNCISSPTGTGALQRTRTGRQGRRQGLPSGPCGRRGSAPACGAQAGIRIRPGQRAAMARPHHRARTLPRNSSAWSNAALVAPKKAAAVDWHLGALHQCSARRTSMASGKTERPQHIHGQSSNATSASPARDDMELPNCLAHLLRPWAMPLNLLRQAGRRELCLARRCELPRARTTVELRLKGPPYAFTRAA